MFELSIEREFCAAHALVISGVREAMHGHNWKVTATVRGMELDPDGLLCDFHTVAEVLGSILSELDNRNLHEVEALRGKNPTAEVVACHIHGRLSERLDGALAPHARVWSVRVTEAPGCAATYRGG